MKLYPLVLILSGIFLLAACGAGNPYPLVPGANPGVTTVVITAQPLITSTAWPTNVTTPQEQSPTPFPPAPTVLDQADGNFFQGPGPAGGNSVQPAQELPQTAPDVNGIFESRQGSSIFVGTGGVTTIVQPGGAPQTSHSGPTMEVIVTNETTIYKDVTMDQFSSPPPEGQKIQQVVEPGSLEEVGQDSMITVWGRKVGDRIFADVLVYSLPAFMTK
jgi:hypothetical protein